MVVRLVKLIGGSASDKYHEIAGSVHATVAKASHLWIGLMRSSRS